MEVGKEAHVLQPRIANILVFIHVVVLFIILLVSCTVDKLVRFFSRHTAFINSKIYQAVKL